MQALYIFPERLNTLIRLSSITNMTLVSSMKTTHFHPPSVQSSCFLAQLNLAARCPELNLSFPTFFWSGCRLLSIYCELVEHSQRCSCTSAEVGCETLLKSSPGKKPFSSGSFFFAFHPPSKSSGQIFRLLVPILEIRRHTKPVGHNPLRKVLFK